MMESTITGNEHQTKCAVSKADDSESTRLYPIAIVIEIGIEIKNDHDTDTEEDLIDVLSTYVVVLLSNEFGPRALPCSYIWKRA